MAEDIFAGIFDDAPDDDPLADVFGAPSAPAAAKPPEGADPYAGELADATRAMGIKTEANQNLSRIEQAFAALDPAQRRLSDRIMDSLPDDMPIHHKLISALGALGVEGIVGTVDTMKGLMTGEKPLYDEDGQLSDTLVNQGAQGGLAAIGGGMAFRAPAGMAARHAIPQTELPRTGPDGSVRVTIQPPAQAWGANILDDVFDAPAAPAAAPLSPEGQALAQRLAAPPAAQSAEATALAQRLGTGDSFRFLDEDANGGVTLLQEPDTGPRMWRDPNRGPEFGSGGGAAVQPQPPTFTPTGDEAVVLDRMVPHPTEPSAAKALLADPKGVATQAADDALTAVFDDLRPVEVAQKAMHPDTDLATEVNPYEQMRLARGAPGKAEHFIKFGAFDRNTGVATTRGLKEILSPVQDIKGFKAYMLARRDMELAERDIATGIDRDAARRVVDAGNDTFGPVFNEAVEHQHAVLKYLKDSGMISDDVFDKMLDANQNYVPFWRLMDDVPSTKGYKLRSSALRSIKGSERQILDPLESWVRNTYATVGLAERNAANRVFFDLVDSSPVGPQFAKKVVAQARPIEVEASEVAKFLDEHDMDTSAAEGMTIWRRNAVRPAPDQIAVWRDGKREIYEVTPELANALQGLDKQSAGVLTKMMRPFSRTARAGLTLTPQFVVRNTFRDQIQAAVQSKHGYRPVYDMMKGLVEIGRGGQQYRDWLKSGGAQSAVISMDRDYVGHSLVDIATDKTVMSRVKNVVTSPLELMRVANEVVDRGTRVGEFMRARAKGKTPQAAAMAARDVTMDFQRIGAKVRGINQLTTFLNSHLQGLSREMATLTGAGAKTGKERAKNIGRAVTTAGALITLPSIYLYMANRGDPRYENAPNWEKDLFWHILPDDPNAEAIRVPKPFTYGLLFGSLPERTLAKYFDEKPDAYKDFMGSISGAVIPDVMPTMMKPMVEQTFNKSIFMDAPLVGKRQSGMMAPEQTTTNTTEFSKALGRGVASIPGMEDSSFASPIVLDNYIRGWGGELGLTGAKALDPLLRGKDAPPLPASTLADIPVIRAFISRYPSAGAQPISDFYDKHDRLEKLHKTGKALTEAGNPERAKVYTEDAVTRTGSVKTKLDQMHKQIRSIYADMQMTPDMKRDVIRQTYLDMIDMAQYGNRLIRDAEKAQEEEYGGPR